MARDRIDEIEEGMSRFLGDVAAHQLGRLLRGAGRWGGRTVRTAAQNVAEYLQEESRDLVAGAEMEMFDQDVERLKKAVDQLSARVDALAEKRRVESE